jgi:glycosyltransferase involved in cell wall biosynthesis
LQIHTDIGSPFFTNSQLNKLRILIAKYLLPRANNIRVVSQRIKKTLTEQFNIEDEKICVLPIRISVPNTTEVQPKKFLNFRPTLLTVARLEKEKNVGQSLVVLAEIIKKYPDAGLIIVGDGSEKKNLIKNAKNLRIFDKVIFAGKQLGALSFIKGADIFLVTSFYEGYSLVLAESAYLSVPIVTADVGIAGEHLINMESALVCPVGDTSCFVRAIESMIENSTFKNRLAVNAHRSIVDSVPDEAKFLEQYKNCLKSCLKK